jgi:prephenate dehydrogenase
MKVAIVGGAGKMGRLFGGYLERNGHEISIIDPKATSSRFTSPKISSIREVDVVIVSVPMERMTRVLQEVRVNLKGSSQVIELSSLKSVTHTMMRKIAVDGHTSVSLHPLFGPGIRDLDRARMALIPVLNEGIEKKLVRKLFPKGKIVVVELKEHEHAMTSILSLTYFSNLLFAASLKKQDLKTFRTLTGTTFSIQLTLSEALLNEDPSLFASILLLNPEFSKIAQDFANRTKTLAQQIEKKDRASVTSQLKAARKILGDSESLNRSYQKLYAIISKLDN